MVAGGEVASHAKAIDATFAQTRAGGRPGARAVVDMGTVMALYDATNAAERDLAQIRIELARRRRHP
jgi:hypothetical protein